jgi:hypothetical protein
VIQADRVRPGPLASYQSITSGDYWPGSESSCHHIAAAGPADFTSIERVLQNEHGPRVSEIRDRDIQDEVGNPSQVQTAVQLQYWALVGVARYDGPSTTPGG